MPVRCSWLYLGGICGFVSALLLAVAVVVPIEVPKMIKDKFTVEGPQAALYNSFIDSTKEGMPLYQSNYFFNITNPDEVMAGGRAKLKEVGPYTYRVVKTRPEEYVKWFPNATVRWRNSDEYVFVPEMSCSTSDRDNITTVSLGALVMHYKMRKSPVMEWLIDLGSKYVGESYLTVKTPKELLAGYQDPLLNYFGIHDPVAFEADTKPSELLSETYDECYTGGKASKWQPTLPNEPLRKVTMWQGMRTLEPYWETSYANMINGTDGTQFHPGISCDERPFAFVSDLRRSVVLECSEQSHLRGVALNDFKLAPENLASYDQIPDNRAFNLKYQGLLPSPVGPVFLSKPYYLGGEVDSIIDADLGGVADVEKHDTTISVEPYTGAPFKVHKRLQMSVMAGELKSPNPLNNSEEIVWKLSKGVRSTLLPLYWADEHIVVPENVTTALKNELLRPIFYSKLFGFGGAVLFAIAAVLCCVQAFCGCLRCCTSHKQVDESDYMHLAEEQEVVNGRAGRTPFDDLH